MRIVSTRPPWTRRFESFVRRTAPWVALIAVSCARPRATAAQARWQLLPDTTVVIGSVDGPPSETLHDVRGAVTTTSGMIVVADGGSTELRVFSVEGEFVRSFGGFGDGPKEFRDIAWIDMCGGSAVVAYDGFRSRITKWDTDGSLLGGFAVEGPRSDLPPYSVSCGPSGRFAVIAWPDMAAGPLGLGPYRPNSIVGIADEQGRFGRSVGEFSATERLRTGRNDRPHPFGKSTYIGMGADGVYVAMSDSFVVQVVTPDGARRSFGRDRPVSPLSREMLERWVDAYLERAPAEQRPSLKRDLLESEWLPTVPPAYGGLRIDRLGFVWVAPFVIADPGADASVEWSVFDSSGTFVATVMVPSHFRPTEIGRDWMLGVSTDSMDVQTVRRYLLSRG